jgi:hypothetical protein
MITASPPLWLLELVGKPEPPMPASPTATKLRCGEAKVSCEPPDDMPLRVEGDDLSGVRLGDHLKVVKVVQGETVKGSLLRVPEGLVRRVLAANNKLRPPNNQG